MARNNDIQLNDFPVPSYDRLEQQVLADAISLPSLIGDLQGLVTKDMFTSDNRVKIWEAIIRRFQQGEDIDLLTMRMRVGQAVKEEVVIPQLDVSTETAALGHAAILRDASARRRTYFAALRLLQKSTDPALDEGAMLAAAETAKEEVRGNSTVKGEEHISTVIEKLAEEVQEVKRLANMGLSYRTPTGIRALDWYFLGGFAPGQLVILAARPSVGKTAVMLQLARTAARSGFPALVFSAELTDVEIGKRLMYSTERINSRQVASGDMDWAGFEQAAGQLSSLPIYINDSCVDIDDACSRVVLASQRGECRIAFFDYLTRFSVSADRNTPLYQRIGIITKKIAATAKRAKIPAVLLCQLSRESARENRAPELYDLKESGDIEQDADIVMMLDTRQNGANGAPPDINIWVRKNRQGNKEGCVIVRPNDSYTNFEEIGTE